ncbi:MAG: PHP-associated domain-containing protein [Halobacteriota archaeon]
MARVDPHVKVLDDRVRELAIERGLDAIVYAPHFTPWPDIVDRASQFSDERLLVVPARELFTGPWHDRKHVLAMDLENPISDFLPREETMDDLVDQGACIVAPHPGFLTMSLGFDDLRRFGEHVHAIEVYNPKFLPWHGPRAARVAAELDRPVIASSYAHLRSSVGAGWIEIENDIDGPGDVVEAIRSGAIEGIGRLGGATRYRISATELAHLCWENSGKKLARTLRRGVPATHPTGERYGGRYR